MTNEVVYGAVEGLPFVFTNLIGDLESTFSTLSIIAPHSAKSYKKSITIILFDKLLLRNYITKHDPADASTVGPAPQIGAFLFPAGSEPWSTSITP